MKKILNPLVRTLVRSGPGWLLGRYIIRFAEWFRHERSIYENQISQLRLRSFFSDLKVRQGFFQGLQYPGFDSFGSALFPKLSGMYESELTEVWYRFRQRRYNQILDIGCAEGFYAVGLAMQFDGASVTAFDISEDARNLCKRMAKLNGVDGRLDVLGECTRESLHNVDVKSRTLVVCDIEGFERDLFDSFNVLSLLNSDLIIELHPMHRKDVKSYLIQLFSKTHRVYTITSYNTARKIFDLGAEYDKFPAIDKIQITDEGRQFSMDWLIAESLQ